ncbi:MAG: hypothetical protein PHX14_03160 [Syntrophomonadaceae bacterium]|nr:hypothetical protein [Syntrophomonadaceae bacterium]
MESSQVFLNKVMLNIPTSKDQGLNLAKGEVLRGVVQEVKADGLISILIKGQVIEAVSEVPVRPGQQMQLMVEDFRDGRTYLKALTPELLTRIENTNISMNLKDIGVPAKESNVIMAKKLLAHNLPVTVSNLNGLSKGMTLLGGTNARNMEIAAFAMQRGIPLTQQSLNSLAQFTAPGNALPQLVKDILQSLATLSSNTDGQTAATSQSTGEAATGRTGLVAQEPGLTGNKQEQSGVNAPKSAVEVSTSQASKGSQEVPLQLRSDSLTGENAAGTGKTNTAETAAPSSKPGTETIIQRGAELLEAKNAVAAKTTGEASPLPANKASGEQAAPAAVKAGSEQVPQQTAKPSGGDGAGTVAGKAGTESMVDLPEELTISRNNVTGEKPVTEANKVITAKISGEPATPQASKTSSEQVPPAATKVSDGDSSRTAANRAGAESMAELPEEGTAGKSSAAGEKVIAEAAKPIAAKTPGEPAVPTAVKTSSEQLQAEGKAAAPTVPAGDNKIQSPALAASDKPSVEIPATRPAGGDSTQAVAGKAGTASMVELPEEHTISRNNVTGEKPAIEANKVITTKTFAEPGAPTAVKTGSEPVEQLPLKNTQLSANITQEKNPASGGVQTNTARPGAETPLPAAAGSEMAAAEKLLNTDKTSLQTPPRVQASDLMPGQEKALAAPLLDSDTNVAGERIIKHLELLKPLLEIMQIDAGENKGTVGAKLENAIYSEKDLIKGLMLLEDIIKNDNTAAKIPVISDLLQKIDGLEKELSGQRILNFASRSAVDNNLNYFYFSFPVQVDNEFRLGQIRINKEIGRRGLKNQDNIRFIVSLDTSQMGLVLFHLNWKRNKEIEVQGVVENQKVCNYLSRNMEVLLQGLNGLGYKTRNLGIKVVENEEEIANLRLTMEETPLNIRPLGIDITV